MPERKRSILVVDDEQLILKTIQRALLKVGYSVTIVSDKKEFLAALNDELFALCIADLKMKDLSFDEIKKDVLRKNELAQFMVISGSIYKGNEEFLQKPFRIDDLRNSVRKILKD